MSGNFPDRHPEVRRSSDDLVDYLLGDLPPAKAAQLEQRLSGDSLLRVELYECRRAIDAMRALPAASAGPGFVAAVMAAKDRDDETPRRARRVYRRPLLALAASLAIIAGGMLIMRQPATPVMPAVVAHDVVAPSQPVAAAAPENTVACTAAQADAINALRATQLPNGAWDSEAGGGAWKARPGLTALVLCGLIQASSGDCFTGPHAAVATRALDYLINTAMDTDLDQRALVVHRQQLVFVGVALSEARQVCRDPETARRIEQALTALNVSSEPGSPRIASAILPHLPEQAARQGGHIYQLARALLLETSS